MTRDQRQRRPRPLIFHTPDFAMDSRPRPNIERGINEEGYTADNGQADNEFNEREPIIVRLVGLAHWLVRSVGLAHCSAARLAYVGI